MEIKISNLKPFILSFCCFVFTSLAESAQDALVAVDGSMVYKEADFDSAVIGYLPRGKKVRISSKPFGAFHRISLRQGMIGYISDADLLDIEGRPMPEINSAKDQSKPVKGSKPLRAKREKEKSSIGRKRPVHVTTAIGVSYSLVNYRELINRRDYSDQISFFGVKYSSRASFIDGSFGMEADALYHSGAPAYYSTVSTAPPSGYIAIFDFILTYSLFDFFKHSGSVTVGAGPVVTMSDIKTEFNGQKFQQNSTEIGAVLNATVNYRFHPMIFKFEPRYFIERSAYMGFQASLLYAFN